MKEERRQYQEEIRQEREELDQLKAEKRALEADITKLKMNKEQLTRKLRSVLVWIMGSVRNIDSMIQVNPDQIHNELIICLDSDLRDRIDKKGKDIEHLNQKIIQAAEETKSIAEERIRASHTGRRPPSQARQDSMEGEEDLISGKGSGRVKKNPHCTQILYLISGRGSGSQIQIATLYSNITSL